VEPTPSLALFGVVLCLQWCWWFRQVSPAAAGGRGSHQPDECLEKLRKSDTIMADDMPELAVKFELRKAAQPSIIVSR
jgi:hypothetical protein